MHPLRSFFTYITNGILSLRKNFHTLRIFKTDKFVDLSISEEDKAVFLKVDPNLIVQGEVRGIDGVFYKLSIENDAVFNGFLEVIRDINCHENVNCLDVFGRVINGTDFGVWLEDSTKMTFIDSSGKITAKSLEVGGGLNLLKITLRDGPFNSVACDFNMPNTTDYIHIWNHLQIHNSLYTTGSFEAEGYSTFHDGMTVQKGLKLRNLPTADPHVSDQVWNDGGTLKISAG